MGRVSFFQRLALMIETWGMRELWKVVYEGEMLKLAN